MKTSFVLGALTVAGLAAGAAIAESTRAAVVDAEGVVCDPLEPRFMFPNEG